MKLIKGTALLLIIMPMLGSIFSCLFFLASMRGTFTKWEMISSPPTTPVKILKMNFVQTIAGDIYEFQYSEQCPNRCWVKVETVTSPDTLDTMDMLPLEDCKSSFDFPSVYRFSDSVIECSRWGLGVRLDAQAIDRDGNIYMWQKGIDDFGDPLRLTTSPILGAIGGFVTALLFFALALVRGLIIYWPHQRKTSTRKTP